MHIRIALLILAAALTLTGCAISPTQVAQNDKECKIAPALTENTVNPNRRKPTEIEQREAELKLQGMPYYQRKQREWNNQNALSQAAHDCY